LKNKRMKSCLFVGISGLLILGVIFIGLFLLVYRTALVQEPLIFINQPHHRQQLAIGENVNINAIARAKRGITRTELWIDGELLVSQDSDRLTPIILDANWLPDEIGQHKIVVRAFTIHGIAGQGSVIVEVGPAQQNEDHFISYLVNGDETIQDIANGSDTTVEEIENLNPGLADENIVPGDVVITPGDEGTTDVNDDVIAESFPESGYTIPDPAGEPPGSVDDMLRVLELDGFVPYRAVGFPVELQFEALSLETDSDYERMHCYIAIADELPRWFPDEDADPTTDESFISLGDGFWNIDSYLSGGNAYIFPWVSTESLSIDITCVGINGGGSDAVDLGHLVMALRPATWDGIARYAVSSDGEDTFRLQYRVRRIGGTPGFPVGIDYDMPVPYNLRLGFYQLIWQYNEDEEAPIDGFRIYLNDTLLWTESADKRRTEIAPEWYHPPCGETYHFTVTAFRNAPDDPESRPSRPLVVENNDSPCEREVVIDFGLLETFDLGRDEDRNDIVGPAYGNFYAMDKVIAFDGRCSGSGICGTFMLHDDSEYEIGHLVSYFGNDSSRLVVTVPEGEELVYGFGIDDHDPGPSNDDYLCSDQRRVSWERLDEPLDRSLYSSNFRCRVELNMYPAMGSPIGETDDSPPQPLLWIEDFRYNEENTTTEINISNIGRAAWSARDLLVLTESRSGSEALRTVVEDFVLLVGETKTVVVPAFSHTLQPNNVCISLDPEDDVPEDHDIYGNRYPLCSGLPDLRIQDVQYQSSTGRLLITVENRDEDTLDSRTIRMQLDYNDGGSIMEEWEYFTMEPYSSHVFAWSGFNENMRRRLDNGYSITIDPINLIAESDEDNNTFIVHGETSINLRWRRLYMPYYLTDSWLLGELDNEDLVFANGFVENEDSNELIMESAERFSTTPSDEGLNYVYMSNDSARGGYDVTVAGDEVIRVYVGANTQADHGYFTRTYYLGTGVIEFNQESVQEAPLCSDDEFLDVRVVVTPNEEEFEDQPWVTDFGICRYD